MMRLLRGWERKYSPGAVGGLRLSKAKTYRRIGEEDGFGDAREGEMTVEAPAAIESSANGGLDIPVTVSVGPNRDTPAMVAENLRPGERREVMHRLGVDDSRTESPFRFCLSREPADEAEWLTLRDALPDRYDAWTVTTDLAALSFEIECGIKRWLSLNELTEHRLTKTRRWVSYPFDDFPPSVEPGKLGDELSARWFRKRRQYQQQQEYRFAWLLTTPQWQSLPDYIDIELTRSGLSLFEPWSPPAG